MSKPIEDKNIMNINKNELQKNNENYKNIILNLKYLIDYELLDYFKNILIEPKKDFLSCVVIKIKSYLVSEYSQNSFDKEILAFLMKYSKERLEKKYDIHLKNLSSAWESFQFLKKNKEKMSEIESYYLNNFVYHCSSVFKYAIHNCKKKEKIFGKFIKVIDKTNDKNVVKYVICENCRNCFFIEHFQNYCEKCQLNYYSCEINQDKKDLLPATLKTPHCEPVVNEKLYCQFCKKALYLNVKTNQVKCPNCRYIGNPNNMDLKCHVCSKKFKSDIIVYNKSEVNYIKKVIKYGLLIKKKARPVRLRCCKDIDVKTASFYHKKDCDGIIYFAEFHKKLIIICEKCKAVNNFGKFIWTCPGCSLRFKDMKWFDNEIKLRKEIFSVNDIKLNIDINLDSKEIPENIQDILNLKKNDSEKNIEKRAKSDLYDILNNKTNLIADKNKKTEIYNLVQQKPKRESKELSTEESDSKNNPNPNINNIKALSDNLSQYIIKVKKNLNDNNQSDKNLDNEKKSISKNTSRNKSKNKDNDNYGLSYDRKNNKRSIFKNINRRQNVSANNIIKNNLMAEGIEPERENSQINEKSPKKVQKTEKIEDFHINEGIPVNLKKRFEQKMLYSKSNNDVKKRVPINHREKSMDNINVKELNYKSFLINQQKKDYEELIDQKYEDRLNNKNTIDNYKEIMEPPKITILKKRENSNEFIKSSLKDIENNNKSQIILNNNYKNKNNDKQNLFKIQSDDNKNNTNNKSQENIISNNYKMTIINNNNSIKNNEKNIQISEYTFKRINNKENNMKENNNKDIFNRRNNNRDNYKENNNKENYDRENNNKGNNNKESNNYRRNNNNRENNYRESNNYIRNNNNNIENNYKINNNRENNNNKENKNLKEITNYYLINNESNNFKNLSMKNSEKSLMSQYNSNKYSKNNDNKYISNYNNYINNIKNKNNNNNINNYQYIINNKNSKNYQYILNSSNKKSNNNYNQYIINSNNKNNNNSKYQYIYNSNNKNNNNSYQHILNSNNKKTNNNNNNYQYIVNSNNKNYQYITNSNNKNYNKSNNNNNYQYIKNNNNKNYHYIVNNNNKNNINISYQNNNNSIDNRNNSNNNTNNNNINNKSVFNNSNKRNNRNSISYNNNFNNKNNYNSNNNIHNKTYYYSSNNTTINGKIYSSISTNNIRKNSNQNKLEEKPKYSSNTNKSRKDKNNYLLNNEPKKEEEKEDVKEEVKYEIKEKEEKIFEEKVDEKVEEKEEDKFEENVEENLKEKEEIKEELKVEEKKEEKIEKKAEEKVEVEEKEEEPPDDITKVSKIDDMELIPLNHDVIRSPLLYNNIQQRIKHVLFKGKLPFFNVDNYTIEKTLGTGTNGVIYQVINNKTKNHYAMKKLIANTIADLDFYQKEFQILYENPHPYLLNIYGVCARCFDTTTFVLYVLMSLGLKDLEMEIRDRINTKNYFQEKELIGMIKKLVEALFFLQKEKNVAHRDIKPENIILFKNGDVKLADFGEAKVNDENRKNTIRGTEFYMSPILYAGNLESKYDIKHNPFKSDVFSLGYCFIYASSLDYTIFNEIRKVSDQSKLRQILRKFFPKMYTARYIDLLLKMIVNDENERVDFIGLQDIIKYY